MALHLSPTLACNYTCAYCGCAAGEKQIRNDFPSSYPELTVDEWTEIWSDILLERFEYGILSITGGEPLLSEATIPVLSIVTQKFGCYITSNISRNIMEITRGHIRPGGPCDVEGFGHVPIGLSGINCSLHPTSKGFNWELFKGSVLLLRNAGFQVSVNYVAIRRSPIWRRVKSGKTGTRSISRCRLAG
jgi:MoaA/NifB/PqqE/SkfB family radical SAM enzyme